MLMNEIRVPSGLTNGKREGLPGSAPSRDGGTNTIVLPALAGSVVSGISYDLVRLEVAPAVP